MDEIIDAGPLGPRVSNVVTIDEYKLVLGFDNGEQRIFDVKPSFKYDVYKPIMDKNIFCMAKVDYGTVVWPGDIDYCPDTLYARSIPVTEDITETIGESLVAESGTVYKP